jgi:hypothetical protein
VSQALGATKILLQGKGIAAHSGEEGNALSASTRIIGGLPILRTLWWLSSDPENVDLKGMSAFALDSAGMRLQNNIRGRTVRIGPPSALIRSVI